MRLADLISEAQLHRETYIGVINGALVDRGSKSSFAEHVGITPQYLSYLLDPHNIRTPSPALAERIASSLHIPTDQAQKLLEHMVHAKEQHENIGQTFRLELLDIPFARFVEELREASDKATFTSDPVAAKPHYQRLCQVGEVLVNQGSLNLHPLDLVDAQLIIHNALSVMNRTVDAFYMAQRACTIMDSLDPSDYRDARARFDNLQIEAFRCKAISFYNLGLPHKAYESCQKADASEAMRKRPEIWKPHIYRDMINALSSKPRFVISEAEGLANQVRVVCGHRSDDEAPVLNFLIERYLGRAYMRYGNIKKANQHLRLQIDMIEQVPKVGPIHRTMLLRTYSKVRRMHGDQDEGDYFAERALRVAARAGLAHQAAQIRREVG